MKITNTKTWEQATKKKLEKIFLTSYMDKSSVTYWDGCVPEIISLIEEELSLAKQQWIEEIGKMKKRKDNNRTTDEKRYPIGFNQAIFKVLSYLKGGER